MNYILFIIPILFFIGIYVKKLHVKENMTDYKLEEDRSFNKVPINSTILYFWIRWLSFLA